MIFSISMKMENLLENEQAARCFDRFLPGVANTLRNTPQALALSVEQLVRYKGHRLQV